MNQKVSIEQLRATFDGRVSTPGDPGYDKARTVFVGGIDHRPAAVVRPADAAEVGRVVVLARESGLELAVRSGGHSFAGHGVSDGGIVLDLSAMRGLDIDPQRRTAWAQTGLTGGDYATAAAEYGLATGFGDHPSVGIGGITLGGGVGYLSRRHGLTIDDLLAAEVVTADGELLRVDAGSHPDLFWAIRGGGGNFGVATRLQFRLHELDGVTGGMLLLPATPEVVAGFVAAAQDAPEELTTIANLMPAPPMPMVPEEHHGTMVLLALMCYAGAPAAGERALAPFRELASGTSKQGRALAPPLVDLVRPVPYPQLFAGMAAEDYHPTAVSRVMFRDTVDLAAAETMVARLEASDATMRAVQIRVLGGAVSRVPDDATAYAHRARQIMVNVAALYDGPDDRPVRQAWVTDLVEALDTGTTGAYVNFVGDEGPARVRDAYPGPTWDRLRAVKARYDPTNLFRRNQNIPPA